MVRCIHTVISYGLCMSKSFNINSYKKTLLLTGWGVPYRTVTQGIIICDKIMVAKNSSKWKFLGELDWFPYYGLKNLVDALYSDCLIEYAIEQQMKDHRTRNSIPINHEWKDKEKEGDLRAYYKYRQETYIPGYRD